MPGATSNLTFVQEESPDDKCEEYQCERCQATILGTDPNCASCGATRDEQSYIPAQPPPARVASHGPKPAVKDVDKIDKAKTDAAHMVASAVPKAGVHKKKVKEPKTATTKIGFFRSEGAEVQASNPEELNGDHKKPKKKSKSVTVPNLVIKEPQCEICRTAVTDTDIICVNCSANDSFEQKNESDMHVDKNAFRILNESSELIEEPVVEEERRIPSANPRLLLENPKYKDDFNVEHPSSSASSSMPWHGGTLVPPPAPAGYSCDEVHNDVEAKSKKKRVSGYTLWTSSHKELIKNHMAPGAVGIRAFGAAAGKLWQNAEPQIKEHFKEMASKLAQPNPEEALEIVVACTPPAASSALPAHAGSACIEAPRRSGDTAPDRPAPLLQPNPRAPTRTTRRSPLDLSEDEFEHEPGREELQTSHLEAAPPYRAEPPQRFSRLEALKARVLSRIRANSTDQSV